MRSLVCGKKIKNSVFEWSRFKGVFVNLEPSLLFHCFLGCLPRKPFQIPLIWYIYITCLGPIGAEIWPIDPYRSTRFGQSSVTRILDPGRPKNLKFSENFFPWYSTTSPKIIQIGDGHVGWPCWFGTEWPSNCANNVMNDITQTVLQDAALQNFVEVMTEWWKHFSIMVCFSSLTIYHFKHHVS